MVIDNKLIADPTIDEVQVSSYYFSVIKFEDGSIEMINLACLVHKISGDLINSVQLLQAIDM